MPKSAAAPVVAEVIRNRCVPQDGESRADLLFFLSLLATRVPAAREAVDRAIDTFNKALLKAPLQSRERWEQLEIAAEQEGIIKADTKLSYDRAIEMLDQNVFTFKASRSFQLAAMLEGAQTIYPYFVERRWSVLVSPAGRFLCSDRPVVVVFTRPKPLIMSPGFGLPDTEISGNLMLVEAGRQDP
jgi:hypothetical protein